MQLRELRVRNIRSYPEAALELGPGTTLIMGDVGSGKTSLLYAVEMALFGFAEVDPTFLIRHRSGEAEVHLSLDDGGHRLDIVRRFRRVTQRGREGFRPIENAFLQDGVRTRYSPTELRQRAIDLLGFPDNPNPTAHSDLWRWAVYIPQEQMREVLAGDARGRLETVRKALGLERYRIAAENAQLVAREVEHRADARGAEAAQLGRSVDAGVESAHALADHQRDLEVAALRAQELKNDADRRLAERTELDRLVARVESDRRERETLAGEVSRVRARLADLRHREETNALELQSTEADAERLPGLRVALEQARARQADLQADRASLLLQIEELEGQRRELERLRAQSRASEAAVLTAARAWTEAAQTAQAEREKAAVLSREHDSLTPPTSEDETLEELDRQIAEMQVGTDRIRAESARMAHQAEELEAIRRTGVCPLCGQKVDSDEAHIHAERAATLARSRSAELAALEGEGARVRERRKVREGSERGALLWRESSRRVEEQHRRALEAETLEARALTRLEEARVQQREDADRRDSLLPVEARFRTESARLGETSSRGEAAGAEVARREREIDRAEQAAARLPHVRAEVEQIQRDREEVEHRAAELSQGIGKLDEALSEHAEVERRRSRLDAEYRAVVASQREVDGRLGGLKEAIRQDRRRLEESEEARAQQSGLLAEQAHLRLLGRWLSGPFRDSLGSLERRLLAQAREQFDRLLSRYFATLVEDPGLVARLDAAFSPEVEIGGEWTPPEALSGGERTALALAYRLALGQVVRGAGRLRLDTLILDEPTDGFSPEQVMRMGDLLEELRIPQIVLVSHEAGLANAADHVVRVTKRNGRSRLEGSGVLAATRAPSSPAPPPLTVADPRPDLEDATPPPT